MERYQFFFPFFSLFSFLDIMTEMRRNILHRFVSRQGYFMKRSEGELMLATGL